ncbi:MAG: ribose 5-phosphate isomerase B [Anaerolineae bacterium]|nr:ribose 5-phosphate isomerase B [Anaerolineae bacterium]
MSQDDTIRRLVNAALQRRLEADPKPIIDADAVNALPEGGTLHVPAGAILTPLAQTAALERRIKLVSESAPSARPTEKPTVAIGADHGGYSLKEMLKTMLQADYVVIDCGTDSADSVDYPDFALAVAEQVASGRAWRGIMIDGAGIGSSMVANKVPGVRAALCYDQATAINSREHNDANVLTLGAGLIGSSLAQQIVKTWLTTDFGGGRHGRRVDKIMAVEKKYRG